ncbi:MAG: glycine reductase [Firmicutes bacterium]|nr:glycine reductase [Bacillota bacterium]
MTNETRMEAGKLFNQLADALETGKFGGSARVVLTTVGSELGPEELVRGAELAAQQSDLQVVLVGPKVDTELELIETECEAEAHKIMESLLASGEAQAAVTLHYNFPLGVATVGRVLTPARGKSMLLATTTGTAAADRVQAMVLNAIGGIAVAKSLGIARPTLGILNVDGARQVERTLRSLQEAGYEFNFSESVRSDGGAVLRGNDLLTASADVVVCDTLTGNLLMKMFSAFTSGGAYETQGWGYGPGVGKGFGKVINIISRASGAPVVAGAIAYAAQCAQGKLAERTAAEFDAAGKAGLEQLLAASAKPAAATEEVTPPAKKPVTADITGIDILELEDAVKALWRDKIYAETGMGCAGPVIMIAPEDDSQARAILQNQGYL